MSTNVASVSITAKRLSETSSAIVLTDELAISYFAPPEENGYKKDYRWPVGYSLKVPEEWEPGFYTFTIRSNDNSSTYEKFEIAIQPKTRGSYGKVAVLTNEATNIAYNKEGGKSNYQGAKVLSFNRPGNYDHRSRDLYFPVWADKIGMKAEFITTIELHDESRILANYDTFVLAGHSEYWSREMRAEVERFLSVGGEVVSLSGNTMWWAVRFEETAEGRVMISCKGSKFGGVCPASGDLVTEKWNVFDPEIELLGASWMHGGYVDHNGWFMKKNGYGGYFAHYSKHWFWAGTGVLEGDHVGQAAGVAGHEADAPPMEMGEFGVPRIAQVPGLPENIVLLGWTPAATPKWEGYGAIIYFTYGNSGGEVFNCGSADCPKGLLSDPIWSKAILNVFEKFGAVQSVATDWDGDGINDLSDNCIDNTNPTQVDSWNDGTGDACDAHCH